MLTGVLLHLPICLLLLHVFNMGVIGLAVAQGCTFGLILAIVMVWVRCDPKIRKCLAPFDMESFRGWGMYLHFTAPSVVMMCAEYWAIEVLALLSGILGVEQLAAQTIIIQINNLLYMIAAGLQRVTCCSLGNCIGAGNMALAEKLYRVSFATCSVIVMLVSLSMGLCRESIVKVFTSDPGVSEYASQLLLLLSCFYTFDGLQNFLQGPIRALGVQRIACIFAIFAYYFIGLPAAYWLAFCEQTGVVGIQAGFYIAIFCQFVSNLVLVMRQNWQK